MCWPHHCTSAALIQGAVIHKPTLTRLLPPPAPLQRYVVSGSDDGHVYVWCRASGALRAWLPGDRHVVNCLEPHPWLPLALATSGGWLPLPLLLQA